MTKLTAGQLVELVEQHYFHNVDSKNIDPVLKCFAEDAVLSVQTAGASHSGRDGPIRKMFEGFMGEVKTIYHGDFTHVVDIENQKIATQFVARNDYDDGQHVEMRNCNFFELEDGLFKLVTIYMSGENPLV